MSRDLVCATLECDDQGPDGCLDMSPGKIRKVWIAERRCVEQGFCSEDV